LLQVKITMSIMAWTFIKPFGDEGRQRLSARRRARRLKSVFKVEMMARRKWLLESRNPQAALMIAPPRRHHTHMPFGSAYTAALNARRLEVPNMPICTFTYAHIWTIHSLLDYHMWLSFCSRSPGRHRLVA
jgi:hypothetical protein